MTATTLLNLLLGLGVLWMLLGIVYLLQLLRSRPKESDKSTTDKPAVTREQVEEARHILVGKSKPFVSPIIPEVPATSSSEKAVDNPNTFAGQNTPKEQDARTETEGFEADKSDLAEGENELQVAYTMDEPEEEEILREELQIADEAMPEATPTAILTRDLARIGSWSKNDESLIEEDETEVSETLHKFRGTELMAQLKEHTLRQKEVHRNILFAIRKAEEEEYDYEPTPDPKAEPIEEKADGGNPLSYYL